MAFDPPSRVAGQCPPLPELVQFLKEKSLDAQLENFLEMSEADLAQMADGYGCTDEEVEQLEELLKQEKDRRAREPSVGGRLAEALKNSGAQFEASGKKVHVSAQLVDQTVQVSDEHRWAMQVYDVQSPEEFADQKSGMDTVILLLGDRTCKQDLINLMLNYNVGMKLDEPRLEMDVNQGTDVHSAIAAFKIPAILGGRVESTLTIINAPDFNNHGMEDRIAGQVKQFLTKHQYNLSGVCCLVQGSTDTSENYKKAFKAVLKELGQDIAEGTMLCIMSSESSDADEEKLQDVWQSIRNAGILYRRWAHFKWPLLPGTAAASQAWQDNSDYFGYLTKFFMSLNRNLRFQLKDQKDGTIDARKKLLDILEKNPQAAQTDLDAEEKVCASLQNASEAATRIVVIGGTGVGKSAFCGLLDGSLKRDPNGRGRTAWSANCKLGHEANSETDRPNLIVCNWRGETGDAQFPIVIMDTPGMGDSRGEQKDEEHLRTIAGWVNGLRYIHLVVILVGNETRMSSSLRKILLEFQKRFGQDLWAHAMVVVNRWDFDGDDLPEEFEQKFRKGLQEPIASESPPLPGQTNDAHVGLGLTEEECNKMLPFAFMKVQYRSEQTNVVEAMRTELDKMKAKVKQLEPWHVRVKAQSEPLNALIDVARNTKDSATLKQVFNRVNSLAIKPADLTEEKLRAVEEEIERRATLEAAEESLTEAKEAFKKFEDEGTRKHAEIFVQKLDMAMKTLPDALMNPRISGLKPDWDMLKVALEGQIELRPNLPSALQDKVNQLVEEVKRLKDIKAILSAWNIELSKDQLEQVCEWGVRSEADLARHISVAGLSNFPPADHPRARILERWNDLKDSPTEDLRWKDACDKVEELKELLRDSEAAEIPLESIHKMKEKLKNAEEEKRRPRKFTTLSLNMDWRPYGVLAGESTRLSLEHVPETFVPADQIRIRFKDGKEVLVNDVKREMHSEAEVEQFVFDIECADRIPTGENLKATLVTSKEAATFSGQMTIPGQPIFKVPFDDKHWYWIRFFHGEVIHVHWGRDGEVPIYNWYWEETKASHFRFADTGDGKQEFMILARHNEHALTNLGPDRGLYQQPRANFKDSQIWTIEKAHQAGDACRYYFIKSKTGGVMTDSRREEQFDWPGASGQSLVEVKPATRSNREMFRFDENSAIQ